jgi:hypothetical protein
MFCASMFVLLCCFFWPLYYLTFYDLHGFCLPLWYLRITILLVSSEYSFGILWYPFGIFRSSSLRYPLIPLWYLLSTPSVFSDTPSVSSDTPLVSSEYSFGIPWYPFGIFRSSSLRYPLIHLWYLQIIISSVFSDTPLVSSDHHPFGILWYPFGIFWVLLRYSLIPLRYPRIPLWYLQSFLTYLYFRRTISNILPIRLFDWNKQKHIKERFVVFFFAHLYNWFWFVVFLC